MPWLRNFYSLTISKYFLYLYIRKYSLNSSGLQPYSKKSIYFHHQSQKSIIVFMHSLIIIYFPLSFQAVAFYIHIDPHLQRLILLAAWVDKERQCLDITLHFRTNSQIIWSGLVTCFEVEMPKSLIFVKNETSTWVNRVALTLVQVIKSHQIANAGNNRYIRTWLEKD